MIRMHRSWTGRMAGVAVAGGLALLLLGPGSVSAQSVRHGHGGHHDRLGFHGEAELCEALERVEQARHQHRLSERIQGAAIARARVLQVRGDVCAPGAKRELGQAVSSLTRFLVTHDRCHLDDAAEAIACVLDAERLAHAPRPVPVPPGPIVGRPVKYYFHGECCGMPGESHLVSAFQDMERAYWARVRHERFDAVDHARQHIGDALQDFRCHDARRELAQAMSSLAVYRVQGDARELDRASQQLHEAWRLEFAEHRRPHRGTPVAQPLPPGASPRHGWDPRHGYPGNDYSQGWSDRDRYDRGLGDWHDGRDDDHHHGRYGLQHDEQRRRGLSQGAEALLRLGKLF